MKKTLTTTAYAAWRVDIKPAYTDSQWSQTASLQRTMSLRRNRSDKSVVVRGLPSRAIQTRRHLQSMPQSFQLPEVSDSAYSVSV